MSRGSTGRKNPGSRRRSTTPERFALSESLKQCPLDPIHGTSQARNALWANSGLRLSAASLLSHPSLRCAVAGETTRPHRQIKSLCATSDPAARASLTFAMSHARGRLAT